MAGGKQKGKIAPYLVYANEVREDVKRALVDAGAVKPTMGEIAKAVGVRWKTLSDAQKATYKEKADAINAETAATRAADAEGGEVSDRQRSARSIVANPSLVRSFLLNATTHSCAPIESMR